MGLFLKILKYLIKPIINLYNKWKEKVENQAQLNWQTIENEKDRKFQEQQNELQRKHEKDLLLIEQEAKSKRLNEVIEAKIIIKKMEIENNSPYLVKRIKNIRKQIKGKNTK